MEMGSPCPRGPRPTGPVGLPAGVPRQREWESALLLTNKSGGRALVRRPAPRVVRLPNCPGFLMRWQFGSVAPPQRRNYFPFLDFPPQGVTAKGVRKLAVWPGKRVPGRPGRSGDLALSAG
jgi:hypothetical protein